MGLFHQPQQSWTRRRSNKSLAVGAKRVRDFGIGPVSGAQKFGAVWHWFTQRTGIDSGVLSPKVRTEDAS